MALPRYRFSELSIPEGRFHYTITIGDDTASGWLVTRISIKHWCDSGPLLLVSEIPQLPHWRNSPRPPKSKDHRMIKPAFIGRIVRKAIDLGWNPKAGSGQFHLSLRDQDIRHLTSRQGAGSKQRIQQGEQAAGQDQDGEPQTFDGRVGAWKVRSDTGLGHA